MTSLRAWSLPPMTTAQHDDEASPKLPALLTSTMVVQTRRGVVDPKKSIKVDPRDRGTPVAHEGFANHKSRTTLDRGSRQTTPVSEIATGMQETGNTQPKPTNQHSKRRRFVQNQCSNNYLR
uniref:Uncharacterized protein n=1 Tax=Cannabis sativa TaxID=3483 RepID=A0A803P4P0_CANSA